MHHPAAAWLADWMMTQINRSRGGPTVVHHIHAYGDFANVSLPHVMAMILILQYVLLMTCYNDMVSYSEQGTGTRPCCEQMWAWWDLIGWMVTQATASSHYQMVPLPASLCAHCVSVSSCSSHWDIVETSAAANPCLTLPLQQNITLLLVSVLITSTHVSVRCKMRSSPVLFCKAFKTQSLEVRLVELDQSLQDCQLVLEQ